jgi:hypothetical protein
VFLTLYKDSNCSQLREHRRIRPGQCAQANPIAGKNRKTNSLGYAIRLSENGELDMCKEGCKSKKCVAIPSWPEHECVSEPGVKMGDHISSLRIGYPDASLQFFETSECYDWFEKRQHTIWQHDVFFDDCFETTFQVMDNRFKFAKITSKWEVSFCTSKACDTCMLAPRTYMNKACANPSYVGQKSGRQHNAIRIKPYEVTEASTVLDDPLCVERVASIHTAKDAIKDAHAEIISYFRLDKSCPVPKQNMDLRDLFPNLENAFREDSVGAWALAQSHSATAAEAESSEIAKAVGPYVWVTSYKDKECKQLRGHVKVTEKCTQLIPDLKRGEYQHAIIKDKLLVCQPGCITCTDPGEEGTACTEIGQDSSYIKAVRIGKPEYSLQFFQDPGCPNWHDKRATAIWQHDVFLDNCFKTWAPIVRNDLHFGLLTKNDQGEVMLSACLDKACNSCQATHYKLNETSPVCEDASYVGMPKTPQHTTLRIKAWEESESATIYHEFPECAERVSKIHKVMDLVKEATTKVNASKSLEQVCKSPKQDSDLLELGKTLRNSLASLRPDTGSRS